VFSIKTNTLTPILLLQHEHIGQNGANLSGCAVYVYRPAVARLLGLWVWIPLRAWMFVSCVCCVRCRQWPLQQTDHLFWEVLRCVCVCMCVSMYDLEILTMRLPSLELGWCTIKKAKILMLQDIRPLTFWHRSFTFNSNKSPTRCNNFSVYYPDVCLQLNMFVNKHQDNKLKNCCIRLVIYLNCTMMHGFTNLKFYIYILVCKMYVKCE